MATRQLTIEILLKVTDKASQNIKKAGRNMKQLQGAMLGFGLSTLFAGMALKRVGVAGLNALINAAKIAGAETNLFNIKTQQLVGTWQFLKFSIINALSQSPLFLRMINFLIGAVKWIADLINRFPVLATAIFATAAAFAVLGTGMVILGSIVSFLSGMLGVGGLAGGLGAFTKGVGKFDTSMSVLKGLVAAGLVLDIGFKVLKVLGGGDLSTGEKVTLVAEAAILGLIFGGAPGAVIGTITALVFLELTGQTHFLRTFGEMIATVAHNFWEIFFRILAGGDPETVVGKFFTQAADNIDQQRRNLPKGGFETFESTGDLIATQSFLPAEDTFSMSMEESMSKVADVSEEQNQTLMSVDRGLTSQTEQQSTFAEEQATRDDTLETTVDEGNTLVAAAIKVASENNLEGLKALGQELSDWRSSFEAPNQSVVEQ